MLVVAGAVLEEGEGVGVGSPAPRQLLHRRPANVLMLVVAGAVLEEGEGVGVGSPAPRQLLAPPPGERSSCSSLRARSLRKGRVSGSVRQPRASSSHRRLANVLMLVVAGAVLEEGEGVGVGSPAPRQLPHRRRRCGRSLRMGRVSGSVRQPRASVLHRRPANVPGASSLRARSLRKGRVSGSVRQPRASSRTAASRTSSSPSLLARSFNQFNGLGSRPGRARKRTVLPRIDRRWSARSVSCHSSYQNGKSKYNNGIRAWVRGSRTAARKAGLRTSWKHWAARKTWWYLWSSWAGRAMRKAMSCATNRASIIPAIRQSTSCQVSSAQWAPKISSRSPSKLRLCSRWNCWTILEVQKTRGRSGGRRRSCRRPGSRG